MALQEAWDAITKFDFYMNPSTPDYQGVHVAPQNIQGERASQFTGDSRNQIYSNRANENRYQQANEALYGPKQGPAYQPPVSDMSNTTSYRTGASEPRLHDNGSFVGVNLSGLSGDFTDDSKWNENVQNLASVGAHETVHNLIEPEIDSWAREESGYVKQPPGEGLEEIFARLAADRKDPAKKNYKKLRSLGHEFGAFSSTPDGLITDDGHSGDGSGFMSPDARTSAMSEYGGIGPYVSGDKPFSDLRTTQKKSEPFDMALQGSWSLLKSLYRDPASAPSKEETQYQIDHNQNIFRNPAGFDARWCATPDCNAMAKRGTSYCVPCNVGIEEMRENS